MNNSRTIWFVCLLIATVSCESFLDVEPPNSKVSTELISSDDVTATAAMSGVYLDMLYMTDHFASGGENSITSLAGLSADELINMSDAGGSTGIAGSLQFQNNELDAENSLVLTLWSSAYKTIYQANAILEGLDRSSKISVSVKEHLRGEALFIRAFCHFYLLNCFGDVPLVLTTDYKQNASVTRTALEDVYDQIVLDLQQAEELLGEAYITTGKVRPNKFTATAMLARVYLYRGDWPRAEEKAGNVIAKTNLYPWTLNLNTVFVSTSPEAIWQLRVKDNHPYTNEGYSFGTVNGHQFNVLDSSILLAFEAGDLRRSNWVTSKVVNGQRLYYSFKYKIQNISNPPVESNEYSTVLRLAEQYLIRAEARAKQDKLELAMADVDVIRNRAALPLLQNSVFEITKDSLLLAIEQERRIEFLTEWGHRWFDLKRRDRANIVLSPLKPGWSSTDQLYPLPAKELRNNPKLRPQNAGY